MSALDPAALQAELARLVKELQDAQRQIAELSGDEIDAVVDFSGHSYLLPRAQEQLRQEEELQRHFATERAAILDALPAHIALLDPDGKIVAVNEAWRRFASANVLASNDFCVGQDYVKVCELAEGACSEEGKDVARGIRAVLAGESFHFALEYPCHSPGVNRWFRLMVTPLHESYRAGAVVMHVNITERKLAEEAVRESERRYRMLFERNPHPMWVFDVETLRFLEVNHAAIAHYGYSHDEFLAMTIADIRPPEDIPHLLERISTVDDELDDAGIWRHRLKDGRIISAHISTHTLEFAGRRAKMVLALDVTQRLEAEAALAAAQRQTSLILNAVGEGIHGLDAEGRILFENPAATAMFGWEENEMLGQIAHPLIHHHYADGRDYPIEDCPVYQTLRDGQPRRVDGEVFFRKDGGSFSVEYVCSPWKTESGAIGGVVVNFRDVTERKAAEEALRERQTLLANAQRIGNMGSWSMNLRTGRLYWPPETCELFGVGEVGPDWTLDRLRAMILPEDLELVDEAVANADATPDGGILEVEYRVRRPDGSIRWMYDRGNVECDSRGTPVRRIGMVMDISARKEAEAALRVSEDRIQRAFHDAATGIAITTPEGRFVHANAAYCRMLGYSEEELRDLDFGSLTYEEDRDRNLRLVEELLSGKRESFVIVKRYRAKWGGLVWVRMSVSALRDSAGRSTALLGVAEDITQQHNAEEALRSSQSLLRMASKIARMGAWSVELPELKVVWSDEVRAIHEVPEDFVVDAPRAFGFFPPESREHLEAVFGQCMEFGTPFDVELPLDTYTGRRIWVRTIGEPVRNRDGLITRVQGAIQDISDRREAELELRRKDNLLRMAGKVARVGGWAVDLPDYRVHWSDEICEMLGFSQGEVPPLEETVALCAPDSRPRISAALDRCLGEGEPFDLELEMFSATGRHLWVRCRGEADRDANGAITRAQGALQDITLYKETSLRENLLSNRLSTTLDNITDAFFTLDKEWRFVFLNRHAEQLIRRSRVDLIGRVIWYEFPNAIGSNFEREYRRAMDEGVPVTFEEFYPGLDRWFGVRAFPSSEGLAVYFSDITEARKVREALEVSEERFRLLSQATNDAIWDWDLKSDGLWWNDGFETLFGFSPAEVHPTIEFWEELIHPDDRPRILRDITAKIESGDNHWADEYRFLRKSGDYAFVMDRGYIIRNADGVAVRMIGGMTDITNRKEIEARLAEQAALLNLASDAIIVRSLDHKVLFWNHGAEIIYGWTAGDVIGRQVDELLYDDPASFSMATETVLREGEWSGELTQKKRDGGAAIVFGRWTLVRKPSGEPEAILAINSDITDKKRLEQQFLRAQRMESIGTLAGGIAHDLNNILAPILMATDILRSKITEESNLSTLDLIHTSAQRGADLIRQVLAFSRGVEGKRIPLNPSHLVREVQKVIKDTFPRNISCEVEVPRAIWPIEADPTQVQQVLMNLVVNARDAMPNGGRIQISLANITVNEVYAEMNLSALPGPYVQLKVVDSGFGIPKTIQDKIFEPFFTTKETGKGTGLGLATTFSIIRDHGGFIKLYSEEGVGTEFKVYFPARTDLADVLDEPVQAAALPRGRGELILVVDDEENIRKVTKEVLERFGYRVLLAANGAEGISQYVRHQDQVAAVLTDMSMPIMDGPAMIIALKSITPDLRIVGCSGLATNFDVARAVGAGVEHFVPKPYTTEVLLLKFAEVLGQPGEPEEARSPLVVLLQEEPIQQTLSRRMLESHGYRVVVAMSDEELSAVAAREGDPVRLVLVDGPMAQTRGAALASNLSALFPAARKAVMVSATDDPASLRHFYGPEVGIIHKPLRSMALQQQLQRLIAE